MHSIINTNRVPGKLRVIGILLTVAILATGCALGQSQNTTPQRSATLARGTLLATVSATGSIQPEAEVHISFQQPGTVTDVKVNVGDTVKKGDLLGRLETVDQELALAQAQAALISAVAGYSRTIQGPQQADIDAAVAALNAATANYTKVKAGPVKADYADAEAAIRNADVALRQAQSAYDRAFATNPAGISASPAAAQLEQATNNYNAAKARYDKLAIGPDAAQVSAAWQQVQSARASLAKLQQPVQSFDIDQAESQIKQAQVQIDQAMRRLQQANLVAPLDGVISAVNMQAGEAVGGQPVISLIDMSQLHIDITVDEIDIAKVQPGQEVAITLDALPGTVLTGTIDQIAPTSTTVSGVVSYSVRVVLVKSDAPLRNGMTANASVVLEKRENALMAPNWAIRRDKQSGKSFLTIKVDDKTSREVEVQTGLRNETFSEILAGAQEGQIVLAPQVPSLLGQ